MIRHHEEETPSKDIERGSQEQKKKIYFRRLQIKNLNLKLTQFLSGLPLTNLEQDFNDKV